MLMTQALKRALNVMVRTHGNLRKKGTNGHFLADTRVVSVLESSYSKLFLALMRQKVGNRMGSGVRCPECKINRMGNVKAADQARLPKTEVRDLGHVYSSANGLL